MRGKKKQHTVNEYKKKTKKRELKIKDWRINQKSQSQMTYW